MVYCESCGAANTVEAELCFACHKPVAEELESPPTTNATTLQSAQLPHETTLILTPGSELLHERYRVQKQVGTGGFGAVYKALDTRSNNRKVAIKQINLKGLKSHEIIEATDTFNREVEILSDLEHPNLPRVYEHFTDPEHWYVVMDFIEGQTLENYQAATKGRLPLNDVLEIGIQLCEVLEYLHSRVPPVIFRDLKPANVMLTPYKQIYLIDFGTARFFKPGKPRDTIAFGSPGYAAPEQYGKAQTTPRSDLYSLGATLHHFLTGKDPADAPFRFESPRITSPTLPSELDTLIMSMVQMDSKDRPSSATHVKMELQHLSAHHSRRLYAQPGTSAFYQPSSALPPGAAWTPSTGFGNTTGYGNGQSQSQLQAQVGMPSQQTSGTTAKKSILSRRVIVGGIIALSVIGPRILNNWSGQSHSSPYIPYNRDSTRQNIWKPQYVFTQHQGPVTTLSWSNDPLSQLIASGDQTGYMALWQKDGSVIRTYQDQDHTPIYSASWSPDGQQVALAATSLTLIKTNTSNNDITQAQPDLRAIAWSPDKKQLAFGDKNGNVFVVKADGPYNQTQRYTGHTKAITSISWSSDGLYIASASLDMTVQVWSPAALQSGNTTDPNTYAYKNHHSAVNVVKWSPVANMQVASGCADNTVRVWDASLKNDQDINVFNGHSDVVLALDWSHDGRSIASGGADGTVQVWKVDPDNNDLFIYRGHKDAVNALAWISENQIASGSSDYTVHVWSLDDVN